MPVHFWSSSMFTIKRFFILLLFALGPSVSHAEPFSVSEGAFDFGYGAAYTTSTFTKCNLIEESKGSGDIIYTVETEYGMDAYSFSTSYDLTTSSLSESEVSIIEDNETVSDLTVSKNGEKLMVLNDANVFSYDLSKDDDICTKKNEEKLGNAEWSDGYSINSDSLEFNSDGSKYYVNDGSNIHSFNSQNNFEVKSGTHSDTVSFSTGGNSIVGIAFNNDGTKLILLDAGGTVRSYSLSTAFDLSTKSSLNTYSTSKAGPEEIEISYSGDKFFVLFSDVDNSYWAIRSYSMSTDFDISTASYSNELNIKQSHHDSTFNYFEGFTFTTEPQY